MPALLTWACWARVAEGYRMPLLSLLIFHLICKIAVLPTYPGDPCVWFWPEPPVIRLAAADLTQPVHPAGNSLEAWADCYAFTQQGVRACALQGRDEIQGLALARLLDKSWRRVTNRQDQGWQAMLSRFSWQQPVMEWRSMAWLRSAGAVPLATQKNIGGMLAATRDYGFEKPWKYFKALRQQLYYDLALALRLPEGRRPFSGWAAGFYGKRTADGRAWLVILRDCQDNEALDQNKLVLRIQPENGLAFLSVGWPGLWGAYSGVNEARVAVAAIPAYSQRTAASGRAAAMVVREALTQAHNLEQAVQLISAAPVVVAQSFLVASGREQRMVVVEKTPGQSKIVLAKDQMMIATAGLTDPAFAADPQNQRQRQGPAGAHRKRLQEFAREHETKPLALQDLTGLVRDRQGANHANLGWGHESSLNPMRAQQAVIMDVASATVWVAAYPHGLGAMVPFSLEQFNPEFAPAVVAADPALAAGDYDRWLIYLRSRREAELQLAAGRYQACLARLVEIENMNPLDYRGRMLAGKALLALGRLDEARYCFQQALLLKPAWPAEQEFLRRKLRDLQNQ